MPADRLENIPTPVKLVQRINAGYTSIRPRRQTWRCDLATKAVTVEFNPNANLTPWWWHQNTLQRVIW